MAGRHAQPSERIRLSRRGKAAGGAAVVVLVGAALCAWPASGDDHRADGTSVTAQDRPAAASSKQRPTGLKQGSPVRSEPGNIPGLDTSMRDRIPAKSRQVLVVTGEDTDSHDSTVTLYTRAKGSEKWHAGDAWPAHNAAKGWTKDHHYGDLRSPEGVFTLSDAGGKLAAPRGTKLPYDHDSSFVANGSGVEGEPLAGAFDYVIAIDYNRVPGSSPLDGRRPEGADKGGGVWLHVDHDGPTQGCVSLKADKMRELLRTLDPAQHPVIVMGPSGP
ncbi:MULTISPECIES: L,D-transpeptidase family protein [Streptomyces]|uniref:Lipoprotein n=1 Tax=Streptomyces olivaceiscleroticus TaxID=68245 RepID=A0ABN0ZD19_9ACTN|nr:L,D-transpeptidase family protein [Streptomyces niger]